MSKFAQYLEEKKGMSRGELDRTLRASDSDADVNSLKAEVSEFYSNLIGDVAGMKKIFAKAKTKPAVSEVQLFIVAYKKLKSALTEESQEEK
jgi:hypothetical protein